MNLFLNQLLAKVIFVLITEMTAVLLVKKLVDVQSPVIHQFQIGGDHLDMNHAYPLMGKLLFTNAAQIKL